MTLTFTSLDDIRKHGFDTLIDVRSPAEFALDHIPGAINLPSLFNEERAEVGTIYKQVSPFKARKIGAALVLKNVAHHIEGPLSDYDGGWRALVYCWRGGQRSGVFATLLKEIGWRAETIAGGYQTYRRLVQQSLYETALPHRMVLLDGYTGTAKTAVLAQLAEMGQQMIDLEKLAGHRGSLLGEMPGGQPSQRGFETALAEALATCDPDKPTVVEAESSKIGKINLPPSLWQSMIGAPRIRITAPLHARVAFIAEAYREILSCPDTVETRLAPLRRLRGHAVVGGWHALQKDGDIEGLAKALIEDHYDRAYDTSAKGKTFAVLAEVAAMSLDQAGLRQVAEEVSNTLKQL
ncbi:tRNA 2-selenouridine(34) synthase MnmH [Cognatiyoonia sp.]|uniref:tRNA 2-selenouridine(34) synthase MnmH n=1 Tax=Cognatiyoonia sp. TaxID=2211652 RepID=UPI003F697D64